MNELSATAELIQTFVQRRCELRNYEPTTVRFDTIYTDIIYIKAILQDPPALVTKTLDICRLNTNAGLDTNALLRLLADELDKMHAGVTDDDLAEMKSDYLKYGRLRARTPAEKRQVESANGQREMPLPSFGLEDADEVTTKLDSLLQAWRYADGAMKDEAWDQLIEGSAKARDARFQSFRQKYPHLNDETLHGLAIGMIREEWLK